MAPAPGARARAQARRLAGANLGPQTISNDASGAALAGELDPWNACGAAMPAAAVCPARSAQVCWMAWNAASARSDELLALAVTYFND